jgi:hypothetical protein
MATLRSDTASVYNNVWVGIIGDLLIGPCKLPHDFRGLLFTFFNGIVTSVTGRCTNGNAEDYVVYA